jgi:hypothetical protein
MRYKLSTESYEYVAGKDRRFAWNIAGYLDRPLTRWLEAGISLSFSARVERGANRRERKIAQDFSRRDIIVRIS